MIVEEKYTHSKTNKDNSSIYQTQILALSPVGWAQRKLPPPISALQSISLSDHVISRSKLPYPHQLSCWLVFLHALLPTYQMPVEKLSAFKSTSQAVCQLLLLSQRAAHPPTLLFSLMPSPSPFHGGTALLFVDT